MHLFDAPSLFVPAVILPALLFLVGWALMRNPRDYLGPVFLLTAGMAYYSYAPLLLLVARPELNVWDFSMERIAWMTAGVFAIWMLVPTLPRMGGSPFFARLGRPRSIPPVVILAIAGLTVVLAAVVGRPASPLNIPLLHGIATQFVAASFVLPLAAAFTAEAIPSRRMRGLFIVFVAVLVILAIFLVVGSERRTILRVVIFAVVGLHYTIRRVPLTMIVAAIFVFLPLIYLLKIEQSARSYFERPVTALTAQELQYVESIWRERYGEDDPLLSLFASGDNLTAFQNMILVLDYIDQEDFAWGVSYWKILLAPIPRALWSDKPLGLNIRITDELPVEEESMAQPITIIGEAYWNFGMIGVFLVPLVFGCLIKTAYTSQQQYDGMRLPHLAYLVAIPFIAEWFRGSFHAVIMPYLISVGLVLVLMMAGDYLRSSRLAVRGSPALPGGALRPGAGQ